MAKKKSEIIEDMSLAEEEMNISETGEAPEEIKSPIKAIRAFCVECMGGQPREVKFCAAPRCPLFAFRMGKNPYIKRELTEEQRLAFAERAKKAREAKS